MCQLGILGKAGMGRIYHLNMFVEDSSLHHDKVNPIGLEHNLGPVIS